MSTMELTLWVVSIVLLLIVTGACLLLFYLSRSRVNLYAAMILFGVFVDKAMAVTGLAFEQEVNARYVVLRSVGTVVLMLCVLLFALNKIGILNRIEWGKK